MPPKSRKRKATPTNGSANETNGTLIVPDRATWPGWVEMESEPALFNVMLKEMGVRAVKIQEVYGLEDESLAILPQPVHALIFLFRYRETDKDRLGTECPENIWFAEQVPDFACASVALLNIVNNIPGLEMGKELRDFKAFTQDMDPHSRGDAIDDFAFVKSIHNSFASDNDMLVADMSYKEKIAAANKHRAVAKAKKTKAAKAATKAANEAAAVDCTSNAYSEAEGSADESKPKDLPTPAKAAVGKSPAIQSSIEVKASASPNIKTGLKATPAPAVCSEAKNGTPTTRSSGRLTRATSKAAAAASRSPTPAAKRPSRPTAEPASKLNAGKLANGTSQNKSCPNGASTIATSVPDSDSELTELNSSPAPMSRKKAGTSKKPKTKPGKVKPDPNGDFASTAGIKPTPQARRSSRQPQPRRDIGPIDGNDDADTPKRASGGKASYAEEPEIDEEGFHFCAYMPIGDHVWKLDGLDKFPQDMGAIDTASSQDWLSIAQPELQSRLLQYAEGAIEFNLMSLVHDPLVANVEALSANIKALQEIEKSLTALVEDWKEMDGTEVSRDVVTGMSAEFNITQVDLNNSKLSTSITKQLITGSNDLLKLLELRKDIVSQQSRLRAACRDELESAKRDAEHARHQRHDYQGMLKQWFEALAEQEQLSALVDGI